MIVLKLILFIPNQTRREILIADIMSTLADSCKSESKQERHNDRILPFKKEFLHSIPQKSILPTKSKVRGNNDDAIRWITSILTSNQRRYDQIRYLLQ
jgi:hypothetical protein